MSARGRSNALIPEPVKSKRTPANAVRPMVAIVWAALVALSSLATAQPILIGQSGGFSGGQAEYARDVKLGIDAAFAVANVQGGVQGRPLQLVTADDGGKRDVVLANTRKLVEQDKVLALIGYTSGAGTEGALGYIGEAKVPLLAPATGNMGIRLANSPYVFHTRAGYDDEMAKIVGHVAALGYTRVALAYLADVGPANLQSMQAALAAHKLQPVAVVGLDRNASDFGAQVQQLMAARAQLVVFISNAKPIVAIVQAMRRLGYHGQFATSSFAGSRVVADLKEHAPGLILIQVLPQPHRDHLQFHKAFHDGLRRVAPGAKPNYTMLEGYVAGHVLAEALRRAGPGVTRAQLLSTLESMGELDLGGYRIRFAANSRRGSRYVDLGVVTDEGRLRF
jgi:branched-chain amino acid transport system substrate-binding protein